MSVYGLPCFLSVGGKSGRGIDAGQNGNVPSIFQQTHPILFEPHGFSNFMEGLKRSVLPGEFTLFFPI